MCEPFEFFSVGLYSFLTLFYELLLESVELRIITSACHVTEKFQQEYSLTENDDRIC